MPDFADDEFAEDDENAEDDAEEPLSAAERGAGDRENPSSARTDVPIPTNGTPGSRDSAGSTP
jgi:hypothetical protein